MVACVHHVPGRARFKIDALRRDPALVQTIEREVAALPGVASVEVNRLAASIIVHYCTERGDLSRIMDHICVHCPHAPAHRRAPAGQKIAVNGAVRPGPRLSPETRRALSEAAGKAVVNTLIKGFVDRGFARILTGLR